MQFNMKLKGILPTLVLKQHFIIGCDLTLLKQHLLVFSSGVSYRNQTPAFRYQKEYLVFWYLRKKRLWKMYKDTQGYTYYSFWQGWKGNVVCTAFSPLIAIYFIYVSKKRELNILQLCLMHMSFLTLCTRAGNISGRIGPWLDVQQETSLCPKNKQGAPVPRLGTCLQYKADDLNNSLPKKHALVFLDIQPNKTHSLFMWAIRLFWPASHWRQHL